MSITIDYITIPDSSSLLFSVVSGSSTSFSAGFEWYLNGILVGIDSIYTLVSPLSTDYVYAKVKDYAASGCTTYWYDGHFYGGTFTGNFADGTFHYGLLNGVPYLEQLPKLKHFIIDSNRTN